jgi:hypothetical protein
MPDDERGAPADFPGRVFPNPKNIKPVLDTDIKPEVDEPSGGGEMSIENAPLKTPDGDTHLPPKIKTGPDTPKLRRLPKHTHVYDRGGVVAPAKDTKMAEMNPYAKITAGDKKPKKEIKTIETRRTHDGKTVHVHKHHHPEHHPDEEHVSTSMADIHKHADDHMGTPNDGESAPTGPDAPAPLTASPSPMPAPAGGGMPGMGA